MTHQRDGKTWLKIWTFSLLVLVIISYAGFQARKIVEGPDLKLNSPLSGVQSASVVDVAGIASNIKEITLNGTPIFIDEQGNFSEKVPLSAGYNVIRIEAKDKFNKETEKTLELVYKG